jgi:hypothetical protein
MKSTRQQVADYIINDDSDIWSLGASTIFYISKNHFQHNSFEVGDIDYMLNLCSDDDILAFARDEELIEGEAA